MRFDGLDDLQMLARIIEAEAGAEPLVGKLAVGAVIDNRRKSGGYGEGWRGVITKPGQFSAINDVTGYAGGKGANSIFWREPSEDSLKVAQLVMAGQYPDPTEGATHYYNPKIASPKWGGNGFSPIGNHVFGRADAGRTMEAGGGQDTMVGGEGPDRALLLQEAMRRGLIDRDALMAEAKRRGLVKAEEPAKEPTEKPSIWDKAREYGILSQGTEEIAEGIAGGDLGMIGKGLGMAAKDVLLDTPGRALSALEGATLGHSGEIVGAVAPETGAAMDAAREQFAAENPAQAMAAEMGGAGAVTAGPAGAALKAVQGATLPTRAATMAGVAGAEGAVYGHGTGEGEMLSDDRLDSAVKTGALSMAVGGALPFAGKVAQSIVNAAQGSKLRAHAPGIQELRQAAGDLFKRVEQSGVQVGPSAFATLGLRMANDAKRHGYHPTLTPKTKAALEEVLGIINSGKAPTLTDLKLLREVLGTAAEKSVDGRRDAWLARRMIDRLDNFIDDMKPSDLAAGSAPLGREAADYKQARELWGRMRRLEIIEDAIEKAGNQASGFENGLRIQFRRVINNKKLRRGFSKDELDVMRKVANGTVTRDALRLLSRFAGMRNGASGALGMTMGIGLGAMAGGPVGAMLAPVAGQAGSLASSALTRRAAQTARAMTATGRKPGPSVQALAERRLLQLVGPGAATTLSQ